MSWKRILTAEFWVIVIKEVEKSFNAAVTETPKSGGLKK